MAVLCTLTPRGSRLHAYITLLMLFNVVLLLYHIATVLYRGLTHLSIDRTAAKLVTVSTWLHRFL
jgi:hypothetical protein